MPDVFCVKNFIQLLQSFLLGEKLFSWHFAEGNIILYLHCDITALIENKLEKRIENGSENASHFSLFPIIPRYSMLSLLSVATLKPSALHFEFSDWLAPLPRGRPEGHSHAA